VRDYAASKGGAEPPHRGEKAMEQSLRQRTFEQKHETSVQKDDMQELYPLLAEAEVLILASPIYYFTMSAQIQAPIQRIYCMNKPGKLKKMALLASSYSPDVYDGAIGEYRGILNYWGVEDTGVVTAKIDEQKTDATRSRILELVGKL